ARHEKAAAAEDAAPNIVEPGVEHCQKSCESPFALEGRFDDFANEDVPGGGYHCELKFFLGAEVCKQPALAHVEFVGESSDGQAFEPFGGSYVHGLLKNLVTGCRPPR